MRDKAFNSSLSRISPQVSKDPGKAKQNAQKVCQDVKAGKQVKDEAQAVSGMYPGLEPFKQGQFIGLSVATYCPNLLSKIGV